MSEGAAKQKGWRGGGGRRGTRNTSKCRQIYQKLAIITSVTVTFGKREEEAMRQGVITIIIYNLNHGKKNVLFSKDFVLIPRLS